LDEWLYKFSADEFFIPRVSEGFSFLLSNGFLVQILKEKVIENRTHDAKPNHMDT